MCSVEKPEFKRLSFKVKAHSFPKSALIGQFSVTSVLELYISVLHDQTHKARLTQNCHQTLTDIKDIMTHHHPLDALVTI